MTHECPECAFVGSIEDIYLGPAILKQVDKRPIYLGKYAWPGVSDHHNCYAIRCPCGGIFTDYPHGEKLRFQHNGCPQAPPWSDWLNIYIKEKELFIREGLAMPPGYIGRLIHLVKFRLAGR